MQNAVDIDVQQCLSALNNGGTILYPTDTVWGIGCDATNEAAVQKVIELKNRPENKSFVMLVKDKDQLEKYLVSQSNEKIFQFLATVQRPTTVVYAKVKSIAANAVAQNGSAAIRICNEPFCKSLLEKFGKPLLSTSANLSGEPTPHLFKEINKIVVNRVNYVVKYRQEDDTLAMPSTIVKFENGEVIILRK